MFVKNNNDPRKLKMILKVSLFFDTHKLIFGKYLTTMSLGVRDCGENRLKIYKIVSGFPIVLTFKFLTVVFETL